MKYDIFWKNPGYKIRAPLRRNISCDYLIVGGGVTGVSLAYFLSKYGAKSTVLIEKNFIASGATGKAAGSLVLKGELDIRDIIKEFGEKKGIEYWNANHRALNTIKEIIEKEKIDCDYDSEDTIYASAGKIDTSVLEEYIVEKDIEKLTELIVGKELKQEINTPLFSYAVLSHKQGISVNPLKFTQNLLRMAEKKGVRVHEKTPLIKIIKNTGITPKGNIKFKKIIIATDSDIRSSKIKKLTSTIIVTKPLTRYQLEIIRMLPKKIIWDAKVIYHYMKITKDNRILLGYGDKHVRKKHTKIDPHHPHLKRILSFLHKLFPGFPAKIEYAWSGSFGTTHNKIPYIEHNGNRITVGGAASQIVCVMAAQYIAQKIMKKSSPLDAFFKL